MTAATYARLRVTDPGRWRAAATAWAVWADMAGRWSAAFGPLVARLSAAWSGRAAEAALTRLGRLRRLVNLFRVLCWETDQVLREFAAALERARALLARAIAEATRSGAVISDEGTVTLPPRAAAGGAGASGAALGGATPGGATRGGASPGGAAGGGAAPGGAAIGGAAPGGVAGDGAAVVGTAPSGTASSGAAAGWASSIEAAAADLSAALAVAEGADTTAAGRLGEIAAIAADQDAPPPPSEGTLPPCTATPAEVRRWWAGLTPPQRRWLTATHPAWLGPLDGVPAGFRDLANRMLLDERRAELDRAAARATQSDRCRLDDLRRGLDQLTDRLRDDCGPRAYLMDLDLAGDGRVIVALGDPDRADNVLTHVPGMMASLASHGAELLHAERVADRATELSPAASTSTVMWLGYDAPDFLGEAAGAGRARAGAVDLRRFQDGLRATHDGPPARQTVLGHSYGSLVVGEAARARLAADGVIFVASPGVGVDSAARLHVPPGEVWATTARDDLIRIAVSPPRQVVDDAATAATLPPIFGPAIALATPPEHLWFGHDPSDPSFGGHVFASQPDAGHVGYWDPGRPALDTIASIALGTAR